MFQRCHRSLRRVRERGKRTGRRHGSVVVLRIGSMRAVARRAVARGKAPTIRAITFVMLRVPDAISEVNERQAAIVLEIIRITIAEMRIETHIGIECEKYRTAAAD